MPIITNNQDKSPSPDSAKTELPEDLTSTEIPISKIEEIKLSEATTTSPTSEIPPHTKLPLILANMPPQKSKLFIMIGGVIGVLVLVILLGSIVLSHGSKQSTKGKLQAKLLPKMTQSPSASSSAVRTNWKTYVNDNYNFSIAYPGTLKVQVASHSANVTEIQFIDSKSASASATPVIQFIIFPKLVGALIGQDFDAFYNLDNNTSKVIQSDVVPSQKFTKVQDRTVSSLRAIDYTSISYPTVSPDEQPSVGTYVELGGNILITATTQENRFMLDYMLSTLAYPHSI